MIEINVKRHRLGRRVSLECGMANIRLTKRTSEKYQRRDDVQRTRDGSDGCWPRMPSPSRAAETSAPQIRRARPLLGTVVEIGVAAESSDAHLHAAIDAAFAAIEQVHALMSYHDPRSDVSRLNRDAAAAEQKVHPHTYQVLEAAVRMAASSDGAFDPVVAPWLEAWGYLPESGGRVDSTATWRDVRLSDAGHVRFLRPLRLDLGGIAKASRWTSPSAHSGQPESRTAPSTPAAIYAWRDSRNKCTCAIRLPAPAGHI
jgi:hypothetical protein